MAGSQDDEPGVEPLVPLDPEAGHRRYPAVPPAGPGRSEAVPVLAAGYTYATVQDQIAATVLARPLTPGWVLAFGLSALGVLTLFASITWLLIRGVGIWGVEIPVAWGFAIANFVWWIGMGHAGTLISAILLLLRQSWRTSINRFAEAMTLFAVACAGMFPLLHMGRPWFFYWLLPYPNTMALWPQFRSPLVWDVFAVSTYLIVSVIFWYVGLVPDLAAMRDRAAVPWVSRAYGVLALGWRGSARHWARYQTAYLLLAALATPLVVSVHTVVSYDFTIAIVPGWHSTIFPPYFVAGAIFSGFAMVLTLAIPLRRFYHLEGLVTERHLENAAKVLLATGLFVAYGYACELFMAWYGGTRAEVGLTLDRLFGPQAFLWWTVLAFNVVSIQVLWFRKARRNVALLFVLSLVVQAGMWTERLMIVITSLSHDYLPGRWGLYAPTGWDVAMLVGTIGFFFLCFLLFIRLLPMISTYEVQELLAEQQGEMP